MCGKVEEESRPPFMLVWLLVFKSLLTFGTIYPISEWDFIPQRVVINIRINSLDYKTKTEERKDSVTVK